MSWPAAASSAVPVMSWARRWRVWCPRRICGRRREDGTHQSFSPFAGVDVSTYITANSATSQSAPAGSPVGSPPSVLVSTAHGHPVNLVNVLFTASPPSTVNGGANVTIGTAGSGTATVASWVVAPGTNTVQAVGTFADPTVTFATGFTRTVSVNPAAGVTFAATGTDVIPFGASYLFLDGAQGQNPGFEAPSFSTGGWSTGAGPFGTGDVGGTVCPLNSEPGFTLDNVFAVNTDLLLRKTFPLPPWWNTPLTVTVAIDNDAQVFMNGHSLNNAYNGTSGFSFSGADAGNYSFNPTSGFVSHENCATKGSLTYAVPVSFLTVGGTNTLAIRARDRGVVDYVDAKVVATPPSP